jgi:DNA-binding response OmpR family regulator
MNGREQERRVPPRRSTKSYRVLVVEPDPTIRALIVAVLRRRGHRPDTAETVDEALELQRRLRPAAVIVEPRMWGGQSLIEALAQTDGGPHPAVIVLTTPDSRDTSLSEVHPIRAILHKPFRIEELAEAVTTCCETN